MVDVEKMFLQVKVDKKDQDVLRYVWRDLKSDDSPRVYRLHGLAFGVNCSPFLAIATVQRHAKECKEEFPAAAASKGIKWKFIVQRSPWRGGWWERLVRNVKEPLRKVLEKALLSYSKLATVLTRIEAVINTRPLTTVSNDVRDLTPITPAHLALGRSLFDLSDVEEVPVNDSKTRQRYLCQQILVNHFWKRWRGEYLPQLSIRPKWNEEQPALRVRDVVLFPMTRYQGESGQWDELRNCFPEKMV